MWRFHTAALLLFPLLVGTPLSALAEGTPAGTDIQNTATVDYTLGGSPVTAVSNTDTVRVAEILDVVVTVSSPVVTVLAGATQEELLFVVTNTGNGSESFTLTPQSAGIGGDDFDPVLSTPSVYFDTDGSGDLSAGDVVYVPGTNDPVLAADASVRVLVVNDIPAGAPDNGLGRSQLSAASRTGTGAPGTAFPGQGDGGVDAVVGTTGADGSEFGQYRVQTLVMSVVKSRTVLDQFGGTRPVPGARINYRVVVSVAGTDTAVASLFDDPIPPNTTYVPGTLALNGAGLSDAADADAGEFIALPVPRLRVRLGDLTQASGAQTIDFAVTID